MIETMCRRCHLTHEGDDHDVWLREHECVPLAKRPVRMLPVNAPEPMEHGDPRRYYSTTQPCRCRACTDGYMESKEKYRGGDVRIAPSKDRRLR